MTVLRTSGCPMASNDPLHVLLGLTGSIGIVKSPQIISLLKKAGCRIRVVLTDAAAQLSSAAAFEALTGERAAVDLFDRTNPSEIQHIAWAQWADAALIAPASANTIGKMACGIADNLLTTMFLALTCPVLAVPAMNADMYANPVVQTNISTLRKRGVLVMEPATGMLACGVEGRGRLPEPEKIVTELLAMLKPSQELSGVNVLVTAGPTREALDPVRFISNRSSGKMGFALAEAARDLGANVTLVTGPVSLKDPAGISTVHVTTAREMRDAVLSRAENQQIVIGCAAVSDYTPEDTLLEKAAKQETMTVRFVRTPDIIAEVAKIPGVFAVGFAAQTHDLRTYAEEKLRRKHLEMVVANDVSRTDSGMESDYNEVLVLRKDGSAVHLDRARKPELASEIIREIASSFSLQSD